MPVSVNELLNGGLLPAVVALAVWFLTRCLLKEDAAARYAPSLALVLGFSTGYWLMWRAEQRDYWIPERHYDWLAFLVAAAMIVGPVVHARGASWVDRLLMYAVFALVAAWLLVPTREKMDPSRLEYMLVWGPALVVTAALLDGVIERFRGPMLPGLLTFVTTCGAAVLGLSGNLRFALIMGCGAGALGGMTVAMCWTRDATLRGMALAFSTLLWGGMLIGRTNTFSEVPLASYVIVPLAPLLMWAAVRGPLSGGTGFVGMLKRFAIPVIACIVAVALANASRTGI